MRETPDYSIEFWRRQAAKHDREGHPAMAITCRNIAWLLEHQGQDWPLTCNTSKQGREHR